MKTFKHLFHQLSLIDQLVSDQRTGTPLELAERLKISKRQLFTYIHFLRKDLKAPMRYDIKKSTYVYAEEGHILSGFQINMILN